MTEPLEQSPATYVERGTRLWVAAGTEDRPEIVQYMSWLPHPIMTGYVKYHQSYALISDDGPVLIDAWEPVACARQRFEELLGGPPVAVICTNAWHERGCYNLRRDDGVTVFAPEHAAGELEGRPDELYAHGDILPGGVRAHWTGDDFAGDSVLRWRTPGGRQVLFTGDMVRRQFRQPLAARPRYAPEGMKLAWSMWRHRGETVLRNGLRAMLQLPFDVIYGAHNPKPFDDEPRRALDELLARGEYVEAPFNEFGHDIGRCHLITCD